MTTLKRVLSATAIGALCAMAAMAREPKLKSHDAQSIVVRVEALDPFTHLADIPEGFDPSSIKFEGVKAVKVATESKSTMDVRFCEDATSRDSGGSMYCPYAQLQSPSPAYQVTYSYQGRPMGSDEYGSGYFTFSVYFRPDELSPAVWRELTDRSLAKADAAGYFGLTTYRASVRQVVLDEAASTFCSGDFVEGLWAHTDSKCEDNISTKLITVPSSYITVKVDPAAPATLAASAE